MRRLTLVLTVFLSLSSWQFMALAQAAADPPGDKAAAAASEIAPDAPVIVIQGVCDHPSQTTATPPPAAEADKTATAVPGQSTFPSPAALNSPCKTIVTRQQFETITTMVGLPMPPATRVKFAARYPEILLFAQQAREMNIQNDPKFGEIVKFGYSQVLAQTFTKYLQEKGSTPEEIENYYKEHPQAFEQVELQRIVIPKTKEHPETSARTAKPDPAADAASMKVEALRVHRQAVAGLDFDKLQANVNTFAGSVEENPDTDFGTLSLDEVPEPYLKAVSELPVGKISELIPDEVGWSIFKLVSKRTIPLEQAKPIAQRRLLKMKLDELRKGIKTELNDAYFKVMANPGLLGGNPNRMPPRP